jgi:hypothetical protein
LSATNEKCRIRIRKSVERIRGSGSETKFQLSTTLVVIHTDSYGASFLPPTSSNFFYIVLTKFSCQSLCKPPPLFLPDRFYIRKIFMCFIPSRVTPLLNRNTKVAQESTYWYLLLPGKNKLKGQWPKCDRYWLVSRPPFP